MRNKISGVILCALFFALSFSVQAQQAKSVPKIGYLSRELHPSDSRASSNRQLDGFREGLRQLGYVEGKNIVIEYRYAEGRLERFPALAEELVRLKVEILVAEITSVARAARKVTSTIPIVFLAGGDPIESGSVASLARPGGNVTGLTSLTVELRGKRLELLKEVVPKVSRFALLEEVGANKIYISDAQAAAKALGVQLQLIEVKAPNPDLEGAFQVMVKERVGGLVSGPGILFTLTLHRRTTLELAEKNRMPSIYGSEVFIDDGGLMYYGASITDLARRGATYVDKILKGAKPADLPVERPVKFDLGINLKAAKQIGLTIPPNVLARADRVIK